MNQKIEYINAKTDVLPLTLILGQITSRMTTFNMQAVSIFEKLQKEKNPDSPEYKRLNAELSSIRMVNEDLSIAGKSINLALDKLSRALATVIQEKYPELKGEMAAIPTPEGPVEAPQLKIPKVITPTTKVIANEPKPQMPPVRGDDEVKKGA